MSSFYRRHANRTASSANFEEATADERAGIESAIGRPLWVKDINKTPAFNAAKWGDFATAWALELAQKSPRAQPGAFVLMEHDSVYGEHVDPNSVLSLAHNPSRSDPQVLAALLAENLIDARAQVWIESLLIDKNVREHFGARKQTATERWAFLAKRMPEAAAWGRLLAETEFSELGATGCRLIVKTLTPVMIRQTAAEEAAELARGAIAWALASVETHPPKASLRAALTRPQMHLDKMARRCRAFGLEIDRLLADAGTPAKEPVASKATSDIVAAFDAKAAADKAALKKAVEPSVKDGDGNSGQQGAMGATIAPATPNGKDGSENREQAPFGQAQLPKNLSAEQEHAIGAGRRMAMLDAAGRGDQAMFSWLMKETNLPGSAWCSPGRSPMDSVVERLGNFVAYAIQRDAEKSAAASQLAADMLKTLAATGLNLLEEARNGAHRMDNPFLRARKSLPYDEPSGLFTQAWMEILARQLQESGVALNDAVELLDEAVGAKTHDHLSISSSRQSFPRVAKAFVESWQLREEIKKSGDANREPGAPESLRADNERAMRQAAGSAAIFKRKPRSL